MKLTTPKLIIVSIILSCIVGFCFNTYISAGFYKELLVPCAKQPLTYHHWGNIKFSRLRNSSVIKNMEYFFPMSDGVIGYYSDGSGGYAYMMYAVLQNLIAPVLLDRHAPQNHRYTLMFLIRQNKSMAAVQLHRKVIRDLGYNLYLTTR